MANNLISTHHDIVTISVELGAQNIHVSHAPAPKCPQRLADKHVLHNPLAEGRVLEMGRLLHAGSLLAPHCTKKKSLLGYVTMRKIRTTIFMEGSVRARNGNFLTTAV